MRGGGASYDALCCCSLQVSLQSLSALFQFFMSGCSAPLSCCWVVLALVAVFTHYELIC